MPLSWDGSTLHLDGVSAHRDDIRGFAEHYSVWTGAAWLEVAGPGWRIAMGDGYAADRALVREHLADRPFTSDWAAGRFPAAPFGLPAGAALGAGLGLVLAAGMAGAWVAGPAAGVVLVLAAAWPLGRLRDALVLGERGVRLGPPWAPRVPWKEVDAVRFRRGRRSSRIWIRTRRGGAVATVPTVLLPAVRARLWRLAGLRLEEGTEGLDERYDRWRGPASGIPWGVLAGTAAVAWVTPVPWTALTAGLLVMAATTLLGAAVEARATGWGAGTVLWSTLAYAVVLAAISLGAAGWMGAS